ncbi:MAG: hypothetical protein LBR83_09290 [Clostridiales bacterium]|jgi:hypothetical protein|nr:hypothetical protein [Clostridiales bacterium]
MNYKYNITGYILHNDIQYFCTVNGFIVKMFYKGEPEIQKLHKIEAEDEKYLFGFSETDCIFAVLMPKGTCFNAFSSHIPYHFGTHILIKAKSSDVNDISYFDGLEFYGETVNKIFNPRQGVEHPKYAYKVEDINIAFKPHSDYSREYDIEIKEEKIKIKTIIYTYINLNEQKNEDGTVSLGALDSAVRFKFNTQKSLNELYYYWLRFKEFLVFLAGRKNVDFGVRLLQKHESDSLCYIADGFFSGNSSDVYNGEIRKTIQINMFEDKLPDLFMLFTDEKTLPYLPFLPKNNKEAKHISYTDVLDICTAFEIEFELSKLKIQSNDVANNLYIVLKNAIKEFRKNQVEEADQKDKVFDVAFSNIQHINASLADKIYLLYERSLIDLDSVSNNELNTNRKSINDFVKLRNNITHSGIVDWGGCGVFFIFLLKILYINMLMRAGLNKNTAVNIAERKWGA